MSGKGTIHQRLNDATGGDTSSATAGRRAKLSAACSAHSSIRRLRKDSLASGRRLHVQRACEAYRHEGTEQDRLRRSRAD